MPPGYDRAARSSSRPPGYEYTQPPPLSKYYRTPTPTQTWDLSGVRYGGSTTESVPSAPQPPLPPRPSPHPPHGSSAPPGGQWLSNPTSGGDSWHLPGPQPSAPLANQVMSPWYDPNAYGVMPGSRPPPTGPPLKQSVVPSVQSDTLRWGVKYNQDHTYGGDQGLKPPLPPRPYSATQHEQGPYQPPSLDSSATHPPSSQSASYTLSTVVPNIYRHSGEEDKSDVPSFLGSSNRPPPPPPKVPLKLPQEYQGGTQQDQHAAQPPTHHYEPESYEQDEHSIQSAQRSEDTYFASSSWTAPPHPSTKNTAGDPSNIGQQLHQASISPVGFEDGDRWSFQASQGESRPPYVSPPTSTHATLAHRYTHQNTNSPESYTSTAMASFAPQEQFSTSHEPSYGASLDQTNERESDPQTLDPQRLQEPKNSAHGDAPNSLLDVSMQPPDEDHQPVQAATVGEIDQKGLPHKTPSRHAAVEDLSRAVSNHESSSVLNNASALGFGGPSDWEYFGDYATEEVDDTELYSTSRPQPPDAPRTDPAELPSEPSPSHKGHQQKASVPVISDPGYPQPPMPSLADGTSPKQLIQSSEVHQSLDQQPHQPTPPLHSRELLPVGTKQLVNLDSSLPGRSHSSELTGAMQTQAEASRPHLEDSGLISQGPSSAQNPILDGQKLDYVPLESSDPKAAAPSGGRGMLSKLSGSQSESNEQAFQSEGSPPIREIHTPPPPCHGQQDASTPTPVKADLHASLVSKKVADPYVDLDAWAKASLNRYVTMLREEARAKTDQERYKIFVSFTNRESRLRAVLYVGETDPGIRDLKPASHAPTNDVGEPCPASTLTKEQVMQLAVGKTVPSPKGGESRAKSAASPSAQIPTETDGTTEHTSTEDTLMTVESADILQYSPGERPIVARTENTATHHDVQLASAPRRKTPKIVPVQNPLAEANEAHSPGSDAPMVVGSEADDREKQAQTLKSITIPPSGYPGVQRYISPPPTGPDRHVYTPFRHRDGISESADRSTSRQSVYRPYSALRLGSFDSGIENAGPLETKRRETLGSPSVTKKEAGEMLDGNARSKSVPDVLGIGPRKTSLDTSPHVQTPNMNGLVLVSLETVLPKHSTSGSDPPPLRNLKQAADAVLDDFSFIHKTVVVWDTEAKKLRDRHDKARHSRQVESEERINALFDEHEIGYGDISELEAEFKRSEATITADEDRAEFETFSNDVFKAVWTRLHDEINQLTPQYNGCTQLLEDALAGRDMFEDVNSRAALAPVMELSLALHQRLEVRYQKAFEAVLERDRRFKKTQVAPLYALGSVTEVKQLEKTFEDAERKAIVDHCRKRDKRANNLMDVLDQNTLRGVGANQDYMEAIMQAVRRIADDTTSDSSRFPDNPEALQKGVVQARSVASALARSSEQIVQTFHVADKLLYSADYEVSVAEARLAHADAGTFKQLREDKAKEDLKLVRDLEHRLALIRQDSKRTNDVIAKVLSILEDSRAPEQRPRRSDGPPDPVHEERIQKALEEAKRRNALKDARA